MTILISSDQYKLKPQPAPYFREEVFVSPSDLKQAGLSGTEQFAVLAIEPLYPGPPEHQFAVRIVTDPTIEPGAAHINQNFLDSIGLRANDERFWSIKPAPAIAPVTEAVIELVVESGNIAREIDALRRERRIFFSIVACSQRQAGPSTHFLCQCLVGAISTFAPSSQRRRPCDPPPCWSLATIPL